jgi:hypothetical protein
LWISPEPSPPTPSTSAVKYPNPVAALVETEGSKKNTEDKPDAPEIPAKGDILQEYYSDMLWKPNIRTVRKTYF